MKFHWYDAAIIIAIFIVTIILGAFIYLAPDKGEQKYMVIKKNDVEIYRLNLTTIVDEVEIKIDGKSTTMIIGADKDGCWVISSGCPDQICYNRGKIIDSADIPIICVPNAIEIGIIYE